MLSHLDRELIHTLLTRTCRGEALWEVIEENVSYALVVGSRTFQLLLLSNPIRIQLRVVAPGATVLRSILIREGDDDWQSVSELLDRVKEAASVRLMQEILTSISEGDLLTGTGPHLNAETAARFFSDVSGDWHLKFRANGKEDLRIDNQGRYFFLDRGGARLAFTLENVIYDSSNRHVSFDKVDTGNIDSVRFPKGKLRQREVLEISGDGNTMIGYAQHDRHPLKYTRF